MSLAGVAAPNKYQALVVYSFSTALPSPPPLASSPSKHPLSTSTQSNPTSQLLDFTYTDTLATHFEVLASPACSNILPCCTSVSLSAYSCLVSKSEMSGRESPDCRELLVF